MLARTICTVLGVVMLPLGGVAGDVAYRLDTTHPTPRNESQILTQSTIKFQDRVWAAPGIEEANCELKPPQKYDGMGPQRFRIEAAPGSRPVFDHECNAGPAWLDEVALPRTREMYGLGRSCDYSGWDCRQEFTFGGAPLQR